MAPKALAYSPTRKFLHWSIFLLVVGLYLIPYAEAFYPRGSVGRAWIWFLHISFGLAMAALVVWRIGARIGGGAAEATEGPAWERAAARLTHLALYALLIAIPVAGVALTFARGDALSFFGLFTVPAPFAPNKALARTIQSVHETMANAIILLATFHAGAALWHHYKRKDTVLARMMPGHS